MKHFLGTVCIISALLTIYCPYVQCLEIMTNDSLDKISAQAVIIAGEINDDFLFPDKPAVPTNTNRDFTSYSNNNTGPHKTVLIDFPGTDVTDNAGNTVREDFYVETSVENVVYENPSKDTFVVFEGILKGTITVPEFYDNTPEIKSRELTLSTDRITIPESLGYNHYICSYQGNIYANRDISDATRSFEVYPNRQTQTVGYSEDGDMLILTPDGFGEMTQWTPVIKNRLETSAGVVNEYLVIAEGESYVQVDLNRMILKNDMNFTIKLANNKKGLNYSDPNAPPESVSSTLGSLYIKGGNTTVHGGSAFITINHSLN